MIKKTFTALFICCILFTSNLFASYTPTIKDTTLLESLETVVSKLKEDPAQRIVTKIDGILSKLTEGTRTYYIINGLKEMVEEHIENIQDTSITDILKYETMKPDFYVELYKGFTSMEGNNGIIEDVEMVLAKLCNAGGTNYNHTKQIRVTLDVIGADPIYENNISFGKVLGHGECDDRIHRTGVLPLEEYTYGKGYVHVRFDFDTENVREESDETNNHDTLKLLFD